MKRSLLLTACVVTALWTAERVIAQVSLNGLVDWFDADIGITEGDFGEVSAWTNQGPGNDVTVADPDTLLVSGPNGQNMVQFLNPTGEGEAGLQYNGSVDLESGYTIFVAMRLFWDIAYGNLYPRMLRTTNDAQALFIRQTDEQVELKSTPVAAADRVQFDYMPTYALDEVAILTAVATPTIRRLFFNGVEVNTNSAQVTSIDAQASDIWEIGNSVQGDIGTVLLYDHTAAVADWNATGSQLASDYGVAWVEIGEVSLVINRATGKMTLSNNSGEPLNLVRYSITSGIGAVDSSHWKSIAENYDVDGPNSADGGLFIGTVDPVNTWSELSDPASRTELREEEPLGMGATWGHGQSIDLGIGSWIRNPTEDLQIELQLASGETQAVTIRYVGNNGASFMLGDMDFNGIIDASDWPIYNTGRGTNLAGLSLAEAYQKGDLDGDLDNDIGDFVIFKNIYDAVHGPGAFDAMIRIPEPTTWVLAAILLGFLPWLSGVKHWTKISTMALSFVIAFLTLTGALHADIRTHGLVDWFDADAGVTTGTGGDLVAWLNQGIGADMSTPDPDTSVVVGPNGQNMIRFSNGPGVAVDAGLGFDLTHGANLTHGYTAFAVVRLHTPIANGQVFPRFLRLTDDDQAPLFIRQSDAQVEVKANPLPGGEGRPQADYPDPNGTGETIILTARLTLNRQELYFNGTLVDSRDTVISGGYDFTPDNPGDHWEIGNQVAGDIGTILIYDRTATASELTATGQQLAMDYGISWSHFAVPVVDNLLKLTVNRNTGEVTLSNNSGTGVAIDSYEISSASFSLDPIGWNSLEEQDYEGNGAPGTGDGWEVAGGIGTHQLIESYLAGESIFNDGTQVSLGNAFDFDHVGVEEDLVFGYHIVGTDGVLANGIVEYIDGVANDADFDTDGDVDGADFLIWQRGFGSAGGPSQGDANHDGHVDHADLAVWEQQFSTIHGDGLHSATIPEPSSGLIGLLVFLFGGLHGRKGTGTFFGLHARTGGKANMG